MEKIDSFMNTAVACLKVIVFFVFLIFMTPVALAAKAFNNKNPFVIPQIFHRLLLWLLAIHVHVIGAPASKTPILFVANHSSYLDIPVLASRLAASFIAKSEVAGWPLLGTLARIQNTIFIERRSSRAAHQRRQLEDLLAKRQSLILFPEGTSSDGMTVLPFKSALFSIVEADAADIAITIQPVSITCTKQSGFPLLREERALYAWYGEDTALVPHLWSVLRRGDFTVEVIFHPPLSAHEHPNRKALAVTCQNIIAHGIEQSLAGQTTIQK